MRGKKAKEMRSKEQLRMVLIVARGDDPIISCDVPCKMGLMATNVHEYAHQLATSMTKAVLDIEKEADSDDSET